MCDAERNGAEKGRQHTVAVAAVRRAPRPVPEASWAWTALNRSFAVGEAHLSGWSRRASAL